MGIAVLGVRGQPHLRQEGIDPGLPVRMVRPQTKRRHALLQRLGDANARIKR